MNITFTKILSYNLRRHDFGYVCSILNQSVDPPPLLPHQLHLRDNAVYYSTLKRSVDCIQYEHAKVYRPQAELNEVAFSLAGACTESEWFSQGSKIVRKVFIQKFLNDSLVLSRQELFRQIRELLHSVLLGGESATFVSHSFRMKLCESYIATEGRILNSPELIKNHISSDKKTFDFGQGFTASETNLRFLIL